MVDVNDLADYATLDEVADGNHVRGLAQLEVNARREVLLVADREDLAGLLDALAHGLHVRDAPLLGNLDGRVMVEVVAGLHGEARELVGRVVGALDDAARANAHDVARLLGHLGTIGELIDRRDVVDCHGVAPLSYGRGVAPVSGRNLLHDVRCARRKV